MKTLEDFLEDQCGQVTPALLEQFEPHRDFVEICLKRFSFNKHTGCDAWQNYSDLMWLYLPDREF